MKGWQLSLYMPDEMVEALDVVAIRRDMSRAALIREACAEKLAADAEAGKKSKKKKKAADAKVARKS